MALVGCHASSAVALANWPKHSSTESPSPSVVLLFSQSSDRKMPRVSTLDADILFSFGTCVDRASRGCVCSDLHLAVVLGPVTFVLLRMLPYICLDGTLNVFHPLTFPVSANNGILSRTNITPRIRSSSQRLPLCALSPCFATGRCAGTFKGLRADACVTHMCSPELF